MINYSIYIIISIIYIGVLFMLENKTNKSKLQNLSNLKLNEKGKIVSVFHQNFSLQKRLLDMGLIKNTTVTITKLSPFGNPVSIAFRNYEIVLRKQDIKKIIVEMN